MRAPRIWGMVLDPRASLGRRGAHGAGLRGVFRALSVAAVESLRVAREGRAIFIDFARVATDPIAAEMASCGLL